MRTYGEIFSLKNGKYILTVFLNSDIIKTVKGGLENVSKGFFKARIPGSIYHDL